MEDNCFTILCWPSATEKHLSGLRFREWGRSRVEPSPKGWGALTPGCGILFLGQAELELLEVAVSREAGCAGPELAKQMGGDPHLGGSREVNTVGMEKWLKTGPRGIEAPEESQRRR